MFCLRPRRLIGEGGSYCSTVGLVNLEKMTEAVEMNWGEVRSLVCRSDLKTKTGKPFHISKATDKAAYIDLPSGEQSVSRHSLEKAERLVRLGTRLDGPADYKRHVADERPAYAWAILRKLGIVE